MWAFSWRMRISRNQHSARKVIIQGIPNFVVGMPELTLESDNYGYGASKLVWSQTSKTIPLLKHGECSGGRGI